MFFAFRIFWLNIGTFWLFPTFHCIFSLKFFHHFAIEGNVQPFVSFSWNAKRCQVWQLFVTMMTWVWVLIDRFQILFSENQILLKISFIPIEPLLRLARPCSDRIWFSANKIWKQSIKPQTQLIIVTGNSSKYFLSWKSKQSRRMGTFLASA